MQSVKDFLTANGGLIGTVVAVLMAYNVLMSAFKVVLQKFVDSTPALKAAKWDNDLLDFATKSTTTVTTVIDWVTGNLEHPDQPPPK